MIGTVKALRTNLNLTNKLNEISNSSILTVMPCFDCDAMVFVANVRH